MIPRLFESAYVPNSSGGYDCKIDSNGIGPLSDALTCYVTETTDATYQLSMTYPVGGLHWDELDVARAVVCKPNNYTRDQPFVIKRISKPMAGIVSISADHVSYDASGVMVRGFSAPNTNVFVLHINTSAIDNPFVVESDFNISSIYKGFHRPPKNMRSMLIDKKSDDSFINLYGGEFTFDRLEIKACLHRGADRGVQIRYGKNLLALTQNRSIRDFATAAYPFYYKQDGSGADYQELPEYILRFEASEYSDVEKCVPLDLTNQFDNVPTIDQLRQAAIKWINNNWETMPPDNFNINFVELGKTTEYADLAAAEEIQLYDTVSIIVPHMNLNKKMRVIKTTYDVLKEQYTSVEIGTHIDTFADTILKMGR